MDVIGGRQILRLLSDFLNGVAPPVPSLDLEMESGNGVEVKGILQRYDIKTDIESWVFPMSNQAVAGLVERAGLRLPGNTDWIRAPLARSTADPIPAPAAAMPRVSPPLIEPIGVPTPLIRLRLANRALSRVAARPARHTIQRFARAIAQSQSGPLLTLRSVTRYTAGGYLGAHS